MVRSLFRSRFQNENSVKGKATVSWRGICWTHTSLTNSNVTPTGSVLSSWQSLGFALKTQPFKPFKPQLDSTKTSRTSQKHAKVSKTVGLTLWTLCFCYLLHSPAALNFPAATMVVSKSRKSHSKKEPMFIKRGWATFCRPKT